MDVNIFWEKIYVKNVKMDTIYLMMERIAIKIQYLMRIVKSSTIKLNVLFVSSDII